MRIAREVWLCVDCLIVAVNGDYSGFDFCYPDLTARDKRIAQVDAGLERLGPHLAPDYDSETGEGIREFSSCGCDACGSPLAGEMHRFAILEEVPSMPGDPTTVIACLEPQHPAARLQADREHGGEWVTCLVCGRQWAIHGSAAEMVTDGDGYCDDHPDEASL